MTDALKKTAFPKEAPTIEITLKLRLLHDFDRYSNGSLAMMLDPSSFTSSDGRKVFFGCPVGSGGVVIGCGNMAWSADAEQFIGKALEAIEQQYLKK